MLLSSNLSNAKLMPPSAFIQGNHNISSLTYTAWFCIGPIKNPTLKLISSNSTFSAMEKLAWNAAEF